jgi:hypothetical protein
MISGTVLQVLGILVVIAIVVTFLLRPSGVFPIVLAIGVVAAGIFVSWNDIEQIRAQRAAQAAFQQQNPPANPTITPPAPAKAGS